MASTDQTTQFERMGPEECLRLLEAEDVGRLAIIQGRVPIIVPAMPRSCIAGIFATGTKNRYSISGRASRSCTRTKARNSATTSPPTWCVWPQPTTSRLPVS